jgi:hypothetical protein
MGMQEWERNWDLRMALGNARTTREAMEILKIEAFSLPGISMGGHTSSRDGEDLV